MPAQIAGEAGGHPEVEVAEELIAIVTIQLQVEVGERPGERIGGAGVQARLERAGPGLGRAPHGARS